MENKFCKSCAYFRQHYTFDKQRIFRVFCGHCTLKNPTGKKPDAKICQYYIPAEPAEDAFVSKEFLSKALLDYMLRMELLPEIQDTQT